MRRGAVRAAAVAVALGCAGGPAPDGERFAGTAACAGCHPTEHGAWAGSLHALAMQPAARETVQAPFDGVRRVFPSLTITPVRQGERLAVIVEEDGREEMVPLVYVLGQVQVEQALVAAARGRLQALPVGFDPTRGEWFDVFPEAPGVRDWAHWRNPGATANAQCLECHVTGYRKGYAAAADAYGSTWHEAGVGCEACHGPGRGHVEAQARGASDPVPYGAVAAAAAAPGCVFCHSRRAVVDDGYVAGAVAEDHLALELLDSDLYHADGALRGEAFEWTSFQMSRMAAEGVGCGDCHEPHAGTLRAEGDALCLGCHEAALATSAHTHHPAASTGVACVDCHMPTAVFMERDARRDHRIAAPDPALAAAIGAPDACTNCHGDRSQAWAATWVRRWYGDAGSRVARRWIAATFAAARDGEPAAVPGLLAILAGSDIDAVRRASAARVLEPYAADAAVRGALVQALEDPDPLVRAGAARGLAGAAAPEPALVRATRDPVRLVRIEAAFALRGVVVHELPAPERGSVERAFAEWLAAQDVLADLPETRFNRGVFFEARGDFGAAEAAYRAAIARWPWDAPPRHNLARLLADRPGRRVEAARELEALLAIAPGWPPGAFSLALLRAEDGHWAEAAALLEACLGRDPAYPRAAYNLGLAYAKLGDAERAEQALERARHDPAARTDALRELVRLAHLRGDTAAQARWLPESLLADPTTRDDPRIRAALGAADVLP